MGTILLFGAITNFLFEEQNINSTFYEASIIQIGVVIIISGFMASFSLLLVDHILKPISKLKNVVKEMENGNFSTKIDVKGNDEISALTDSFQNLQHVLADNKKLLYLLRKNYRENSEKEMS